VNALAPLVLASALGFAALALASGVPVLYGLMVLAGASIAPAFSCIFALVSEVAPQRSSVEAFSWVASGVQIGAAVGSAAGGFLVQSFGTRVALLCGAGCCVGAAGIALLGARHTIEGSMKLDPLSGAAHTFAGDD
jgi:MFS family permease